MLATVREQRNYTSATNLTFSGDYVDTFLNFRGCQNLVFNGRFINSCIRFERCYNWRIVDAYFRDCRGGHFIQTDPDAAEPCANGSIIGCKFQGAGTAFYRDSSGDWVDNGSTGDCIAIRNCEHVDVSHNIIDGGGEYAITVLYGSSDVVVSHNVIRNNDAGCIQVGGIKGDGCYDVTVVNNLFQECGINGATSAPNQACVHVRNSSRVVVAHNESAGSRRGIVYGLVAQSVHDLTVDGNRWDTRVKFRIPRVFEDSVTNLLSDTTPTH